MTTKEKHPPGRIRDAILQVFEDAGSSLHLSEIEQRVIQIVGPTPRSSVRSYLNLNTPDTFVKESRGVYGVQQALDLRVPPSQKSVEKKFADWAHGRVKLVNADCHEWLRQQNDSSIHAVVTDPPYGLHEYSNEQIGKLRSGKGGVWRLPPSFDGHTRSPLPRFTVLSDEQLKELRSFFFGWASVLIPKLVPGAHVFVASNPLLSYIVSMALADAGLERRGEIIRLTMTMRGGDRPKAAHEEFPDISVMPRSMWEPWLLYRKPIEGRVQDNLRKYKTGGLRRPDPDKPFGDVIESAPTRKSERMLAPHPSLKPQAFLRRLVRAALPLGEGTVFDPFAGSGSTLAAAQAVGYKAIGTELDPEYFALACESIPKLTKYNSESN